MSDEAKELDNVEREKRPSGASHASSTSAESDTSAGAGTSRRDRVASMAAPAASAPMSGAGGVSRTDDSADAYVGEYGAAHGGTKAHPVNVLHVDALNQLRRVISKATRQYTAVSHVDGKHALRNREKYARKGKADEPDLKKEKGRALAEVRSVSHRLSRELEDRVMAGGVVKPPEVITPPMTEAHSAAERALTAAEEALEAAQTRLFALKESDATYGDASQAFKAAESALAKATETYAAEDKAYCASPTYDAMQEAFDSRRSEAFQRVDLLRRSDEVPNQVQYVGEIDGIEQLLLDELQEFAGEICKKVYGSDDVDSFIESCGPTLPQLMDTLYSMRFATDPDTANPIKTDDRFKVLEAAIMAAQPITHLIRGKWEKKHQRHCVDKYLELERWGQKDQDGKFKITKADKNRAIQAIEDSATDPKNEEVFRTLQLAHPLSRLPEKSAEKKSDPLISWVKSS